MKIRLLLAALTAALVAAIAAPGSAGLVGTGRQWTLGGVPCVLIAVPTAAPIGVAVSCDGVRPGAIVQSDTGQCSFNFMFAGSDGRRYMGTAGHCIVEDGQERTWAPGAGPAAYDASGDRIGEFAYAVLSDPKDFALIRIDPGVAASPQMCHFGGPTGINADQPGIEKIVSLRQFGQGIGVGLAVPGRTHLAFGMPDPDHVYAAGLVVPGDSGSGAISSDGRAVGVVVTTGFHSSSIGTSGLDVGTVGITRLPPQLQRAAAQTGVTYTLVTAPLL